MTTPITNAPGQDKGENIQYEFFFLRKKIITPVARAPSQDRQTDIQYDFFFVKKREKK